MTNSEGGLIRRSQVPGAAWQVARKSNLLGSFDGRICY